MIVVSSLQGGGTERVVSHLANDWARRSWAISVLTLFHGSATPAFALDPRVMHRDLGLSLRGRRPMPDRETVRALKATFDRCSPPERRLLLRELGLIAAVRRAILGRRPDVLLSFIDATNVRVLLAAEALGVPVVVSERSDPVRNTLADGMMRLRRRVYPRAACLVAQTAAMAAFFARGMDVRLRVIHNPVVRPPAAPPDNPPGLARSQAAGRTMVALGRLGDEKGFDLLIQAFAQVASRHPTWSLAIFGNGPRRAHLERKIRTHGLDAQVRLPGFTTRPFDVLRAADLFVLPSRSEGFPNALCEAMSCGCPVVAADCSSAVGEIVRDGVDGVIVPAGDPQALAHAIDCLMANDDERRRLGARAVEVVERFALEKAMAQWDAVVLAAARRHDGATRSARPSSSVFPRSLSVPPSVAVPLGAAE
jgi:glycosyltransferase involved in cell wall biosynthesis